MNAYLGVENDMLRFRTADDSINVLFSDDTKIDEICRINSFINGMISADVKCRYANILNEEYNPVCPNIVNITYDIRDILELMGISSKPLKKVKKLKIEKSHSKKSRYKFKLFQQHKNIYIEVADSADKKYRSVHNAKTLCLISTTMSQNMIAEYAEPLKEYFDHFVKKSKSSDDLFGF